jgi:putative Mn2+ efflux pump MntP
MDELLSFADAHFRHYIYLNIGVAAGIAADAMIATLSRFSSFPNGRAALKWGSAIGFTHWLFPLVGFIGGWYAAINAPLSTAVYLFGAGVMAWFVKEVVKESAGMSGSPDDDDNQAGIWASRTHFWAAVWGVSIDALVTGPGKTSATAGWSEIEVWFSFPIVGFVVFVLVMLAAYVATILQKRYANANRTEATIADAKARWRLAVFFTVGTWFEILIFSYFGLLAVAQTLRIYDVPVDGILIFATTGLIGTVLFLWLHTNVRERQTRRAYAAFDN